MSTKIHTTAIIDKNTEIDENVEIGPYCVIGPNVKIGAGSVLDTHVRIKTNTTIGKNNIIHQFVSIGDIPQIIGFKDFPESKIIIGEGNTFREYVQVHRSKEATGTILGNNNYLMQQVHIGHDCNIGNENVFANSGQYAGYVEIKDKVFISALVGLHQFCRIGSVAIIGAITGVTKDVPPFLMIQGDRAEAFGLNSVGLRRAGYSNEFRNCMRKAYKILYIQETVPKKACVRIRNELLINYNKDSEEYKNLLYFVEFIENSKRGIISARLKLNDSEDDN